MARISGVDLPREKRLDIGLTYVYGIGRAAARAILEKAGVDGSVRVKDVSEDAIVKIREVIERDYRVEGDLRKRSIDEHQAIGGHRHVSRAPSSQGITGSRTADADECTDTQRETCWRGK